VFINSGALMSADILREDNEKYIKRWLELIGIKDTKKL
jgi:hypothetical protein